MSKFYSGLSRAFRATTDRYFAVDRSRSKRCLLIVLIAVVAMMTVNYKLTAGSVTHKDNNSDNYQDNLKCFLKISSGKSMLRPRIDHRDILISLSKHESCGINRDLKVLMISMDQTQSSRAYAECFPQETFTSSKRNLFEIFRLSKIANSRECLSQLGNLDEYQEVGGREFLEAISKISQKGIFISEPFISVRAIIRRTWFQDSVRYPVRLYGWRYDSESIQVLCIVSTPFSLDAVGRFSSEKIDTYVSECLTELKGRV